MHLTGHGNLTYQSLQLAKHRCSKKDAFCKVLRSGESSNGVAGWLNDHKWKGSSVVSSGLEWLNWGRKKIFLGNEYSLESLTMGIDLEGKFAWTDHAPKGQKFHFMKRDPKQPDKDAYDEGCNHIRNFLQIWVYAAQRSTARVRQLDQRFDQFKASLRRAAPQISMPYAPGSYPSSSELRNSESNRRAETARVYREYQQYQRERDQIVATMKRDQEDLALALHCLQDSFSPAHTIRTFGSITYDFSQSVEPQVGHYNVGTLDNPAPIRKIYCYAQQDQDKVFSPHATADCLGGSNAFMISKLAAHAGADLIVMGVDAVLSGGSLSNWESFKNKWLKFTPLTVHTKALQKPGRTR